jgi:hypothetical protein
MAGKRHEFNLSVSATRGQSGPELPRGPCAPGFFLAGAGWAGAAGSSCISLVRTLVSVKREVEGQPPAAGVGQQHPAGLEVTLQPLPHLVAEVEAVVPGEEQGRPLPWVERKVLEVGLGLAVVDTSRLKVVTRLLGANKLMPSRKSGGNTSDRIRF